MPWLKFFAVRDDIVRILDFVFSETDCRVTEAYSEYDQELRTFNETNEVLDAFGVGVDPHGNGVAQMLSLWSPSVMPKPTVERIQLKLKGATFRYVVEGCGLLSLNLGGVYEGIVTPSALGYWSKNAGFKKCLAKPGPDEVNWIAHQALVGKFRYHTQRRLSVASARGAAVLAGVLDLVQKGFVLKEGKNSPWEYEVEVKSNTA